jgi:hypothetical protein
LPFTFFFIILQKKLVNIFIKKTSGKKFLFFSLHRFAQSSFAPFESPWQAGRQALQITRNAIWRRRRRRNGLQALVMLSIHSQIGDVGDDNQGVAGLLSPPPPHDSFVCVCVCVFLRVWI